MDQSRNHSIIYLCTKFNEKSFLGLQSLLEEKFNVILIVAYSKPKIERKTFKSKLKLLISIILSRFNANTGATVLNDISRLARQFNIPIIETSSSDLDQIFNQHNLNSPFDILLSNGWMFKISPSIFSLPKIDALNCHSSYLPEYRGGNVTYAPLINKESSTGVTVHQIKQKFDSGSILYQERIKLGLNETPASVNKKRASITGRVLIKSLEIAGKYEQYLPNPPSPFYFRCSLNHYKKIMFFNRIRSLLKIPLLKYDPVDTQRV